MNFETASNTRSHFRVILAALNCLIRTCSWNNDCEGCALFRRAVTPNRSRANLLFATDFPGKPFLHRLAGPVFSLNYFENKAISSRN
ncbi:hypothetical protein PUN28_010694 [Cardiocondyla obscurior]|uniref:Secreted protein n=1 Tax=Cardiocondyla obscurior TaxID=286306 RepID=A0AAW2FKX2_9HYME